LTNWDLVLDINGNIAVASDPYSQAQDGASACRTFLGEVYYDTTIGVSYGNILGQLPPLPYLKQQYVNAALTVPGVVNAKAFVTGFAGRALTGQVQMTNTAGQTAAATF
jgi:hypothetical protein